ncbi:hypothetical protein MMC28_003128 [Mycoblastus sanguinarius]|nr:hypothetical protein [Mycoblastus sanguinarius]
MVEQSLPVPLYNYEPLVNKDYSRFVRVERNIPLALTSVSTSDWQFQIIHYKRSEVPEYEAVSYVWGSQSKPFALSVYNGGGASLPITDSLNAALPYLAEKSTTGLLWIDQICIDQDSIPERNSQVPMMGDIYGKAIRVLAWLGEEDAETGLLQELVGAADAELEEPGTDKVESYNQVLATKISYLLYAEPRRGHFEALVNFLSRPWFRRAWIFQEAVLCPSIVLLVGNFEIKGLTSLSAVASAKTSDVAKAAEYSKIASSSFGVHSIAAKRKDRHVTRVSKEFWM